MSKQSKQPDRSSRRELDQRKAAGLSGGPRPWVAAVLLGAAICAVYVPALHAPFIFDDGNGISDNESIRSLWPLVGPSGHPGPLNPGPDLPTSPRPLVNLSLAVNYFFGGVDPFGYHVYSVILHFLTAMLLWEIVRRTLLLPYFDRRFESSAGWLALAVAMLWALHPLVTETVIYATQRSELMLALFYLATLYCSLRYWCELPHPSIEDSLRREEYPGESALPGRQNRRQRLMWLVLAILACLCGMASKEVMVSAPLMVLLFERTFIAGSLRKALRQSWLLYIGLAATWILLLVVSLRAPYGTAAGFGAGVPVHEWWLTQTKVLLMYLKLTLWPSPLLIHYELPYLSTLAQAWLFVLPVLVLGIATLVLLWRNHPVGYLGTAIFAILAPTSLIPIRMEMAAERRMYLPLAAVVILIFIGGYWVAQSARSGSKSSRYASQNSYLWAATAALVVLVALIFLSVSAKRLATYNSAITLWQEVLQYQPNNILAHNNLGHILMNAGRLAESIQELQATIAIKPDYLYGLNNLGNAYSAANRLPEAVDTLQSAVRVDPDYFAARNNLGIVLTRMGRFPEAIEQFQQAFRLQPDNNDVRVNLANAFANVGRIDDSIHEYEAVLAADSDNVLALVNVSVSLARAGRVPEAIERVQHVLRLQPDNSDAHTNLGRYLSSTGKAPQAMEEFQIALRRNPKDVNAHFYYGNLLTDAGRANEAIAHFQQALRLQPNFADAYSSLGLALQKSGRPQEAIEPYQAALRLAPVIPSYANLAQAYRLANRSEEAITTARQAIELAESNGHPETVGQVREWLKQYQAELLRPRAAPASSELPSSASVTKPPKP